MKKPSIPKKLLNKRIPTILGLLVLVIALISGIFLLGDGPGVFAPRATPATTPKKIKITNITDNSFTISFLTDEETPGFVKYGTETNNLNSQASDDRDQLSGTVSDFQMHHITVRGLQPTTAYYYSLGTGSNAKFDDNGNPFTLKTTSRNGAPAAAKTIYGSVSNQAGNPANGSVVYVTLASAGEMSSLVKSSGSWAVPLSNARTKDGSGYAQITDSDNIILSVQGSLLSQTISYNTTVSESQPVPTLTFGQTSQTVSSNTTETVKTKDVVDVVIEDDIESSNEEKLVNNDVDNTVDSDVDSDEKNIFDDLSSDITASRSAILDELTQPLTATNSATDSATPELVILDLEEVEAQIITTSQPKIIGIAPPNITITIEVHSDTNIQESITADEKGNFELDIATLSENLEPGPHEVTYSYTDPDTGEVISKTVNFTVEEPAQQIAQAEPFGSGNPYPPETTSSTPEVASESATASESAEASDEARVSLPATDEAIPVSGSVGTTMALVFGGLFFIISGLWSFWISHQLNKDEIEF